MAIETAELEQQHVNLQFGPNVMWFDLGMTDPRSAQWVVPDQVLVPRNRPTGVRAMYARLAREYEMEPTVPDRRGGVAGDLFPF